MKEFNPLITIIIPVYNGENFLSKAIDSAIGQTYKNIEVLVVDDGSKDKTKEIIQKFSDKRIKYLYKDNGGVASALNLGINNAKGEYISWLSHDDYYLSDKLEKQVAILNALDPEDRTKTIIYSAFQEMNEDNIIYDKFEPHKKAPIEKLTNPYYPNLMGYVNGCTTLIPVESLKQIGLFDENLFYTQDSDMWFRLFPKNKVYYQSDITLVSRKHKDQGTNKQDPKKTKENDDLYKNMINGMSAAQMIALEESELALLKTVLAFLYELKYFGAIAYVEERIQKIENLNEEKANPIKRFLKQILIKLPVFRNLKEIKLEQERLNKKIEYINKNNNG